MVRLPADVEKVLEMIEFHGGEAFAVGGCVRDMLLGREIHDWDICTSLLPEEIMEVFPKTIPTGLRHGTVTVLYGGAFYEVTTYRRDGSYQDHRRPDHVQFSSHLTEDLQRRDFTINAIAMDRAGKIVDRFGGQEDLKSGIVRCVGNAEQRFTEDALRILRAVRFSAQLEFQIEEATLAAMERCCGYCASLSAERVRDEVEKILCSAHPEMLETLIRFGILERFGAHCELPLHRLSRVPPQRQIRWAMLYSLAPALSLSALRLDRKTIRLCEGAAACLHRLEDSVSIKAAAAQYGMESVRCAAALCGMTAPVETVLRSGECIVLRDLAVNGRDFSGLDGRETGKLLQLLLAHVWAYPEHNTREYLLYYAEKVYKGTAKHS